MRTILRASCIIAVITACIAIGGAQSSAQPAPSDGSGSAGSAAAPAAGSAGSAGSATAGSGSGSGSDVPKPTVVAVDCRKNHADITVKIAGGKYELSPIAPLATGHVVRFELDKAADDAEIYAGKGDAGLHADAGVTTCLQFTGSGEFRFHSAAHPIEATIWVRPWYDLLAERPVKEGGNFWLPEAVNSEADDSDMMFYTVLALSIFFFFAITIAVVYLVVKYRHRPVHKAEPSAAHNDALEITWTIIPTIIVVFLFYYGWHAYVKVVTPPTKAIEIQVQAKKWSWNFIHENGASDADLHVPPNTPVRFVMTSADVLHSFYIPVMRIKQDIVPRRYTYAWINATKPGTYRLTCAEYCGTDHSQMGIITTPIEPLLQEGRRRVVVVHDSLEDYERYVSEKADESNKMPPKDLGAALYQKKGCNACHNTDPNPKVGPGWGIKDWGQKLSLADGKSDTMGENYIRESILYPAAKSRPDFVGRAMPSFEGQLKEAEILGLIAYIKSLKQ